MIFLAVVGHDVVSNTLEATWRKAAEVGSLPVKCRNYSIEQKEEFLADCGAAGQKYVDLAGW